MELNELKKRMKGVVVVQTTPFNADGSLDLEGMRSNTRWLAEQVKDKDFIFTPVGSTGEFYAMSVEECKAVIKMVVEETEGRATIMAGTAQAATFETIKMCQYAQSMGADGAQIVLPYYHVPQEEGMYLHYEQVAKSVDPNFGITVYNNPATSGSWVKPSLMKRISEIPNIIAVKENTPDIRSYYVMRRTLPEDVAIFGGLGELMFSFEALCGCSGVVSGTANFAPGLVYSLYEAAAAEDFAELSEIINSMNPLFSFIDKVRVSHGPQTGVPGGAFIAAAGFQHLSVFKAAMDIIGLRGGEVRLPLVNLDEREKSELRGVLKSMKLI